MAREPLFGFMIPNPDGTAFYRTPEGGIIEVSHVVANPEAAIAFGGKAEDFVGRATCMKNIGKYSAEWQRRRLEREARGNSNINITYPS